MADLYDNEKELIERVNALEEQLKKMAATPVKPVWQRFLETTGGAALITVLFGGVITTLISNSIQDKQRKREQSMKFYTLKIDDQKKTTAASLELLGETQFAIKSLANSKGSDFAIDLTDEDVESDKIIREQLLQINANFNKASENWNRKGGSQGLLLGLHNKNHQQIEEKWQLITYEINKSMEIAISMTGGGNYSEEMKELNTHDRKISHLTSELIALLQEQQDELLSEFLE